MIERHPDFPYDEAFEGGPVPLQVVALGMYEMAEAGGECADRLLEIHDRLWECPLDGRLEILRTMAYDEETASGFLALIFVGIDAVLKEADKRRDKQGKKRAPRYRAYQKKVPL